MRDSTRSPVMKKKIAILQSNYIPWKGYFDLINQVDEFILYDDMQYTRRDWRNRNRIKTGSGTSWISVPVEVKGRYHQAIKETRISDRKWARKHWNALLHAYSRAGFFQSNRELIEDLYLNRASRLDYLSEINALFIRVINQILGINAKISRSSDYTLTTGKTERLVGLCKASGADTYLSGPAAKDYIDEQLFKNEKIQVEWMDYSHYPEYRQLHPPFDHYVSILDLIFNQGPDARRYMKSFPDSQRPGQ